MSKKLTFLPQDFNNSEKAIKNETDLSITEDSKNLKFEINQKIQFYFVNKNVVDTETEMIWLIDYIHKNSMKIAQEKHQVLKVNPAYKEMISFAQIFNYPLAEVFLDLKPNGETEKIKNQNEIFKRWEELKENHLNENLQDDVKKDIYEKGDSDFSESLGVLDNSLLYKLLIANVYGKKKVSKNYNFLFDCQFLSNIFTQKIIDCEVKEKVNYISNNIIEIERLIVNKPINGQIKELYDEKYKDVISKDLNYSYEIRLKYHYNEIKGNLINLSVSLKEIANDSLKYSTQINYKLKEDE